MIDSPPPITETSPEKGIKDFNRQYLGQGMWPSKAPNNQRLHASNTLSGIKSTDALAREQNIMMTFSNKGVNDSISLHNKTVSIRGTHKKMPTASTVGPLINLTNCLSTAEKTDQYGITSRNTHTNANNNNIFDFNFIRNNDTTSLQYYYKRPSEH